MSLTGSYTEDEPVVRADSSGADLGGGCRGCARSLDRPTRRRIERLKIVSETNVDLHIRRTKLKNLYDNVYLASFGRIFMEIALWSDSVYWFDGS